ncbi:unnamed protein product, partial [Ectocarpus sp. 12 AP-2014]
TVGSPCNYKQARAGVCGLLGNGQAGRSALRSVSTRMESGTGHATMEVVHATCTMIFCLGCHERPYDSWHANKRETLPLLSPTIRRPTSERFPSHCCLSFPLLLACMFSLSLSACLPACLSIHRCLPSPVPTS